MFKKYPSIENFYRTKEIQWWLDRYPELQNVDYLIQEKLHGANVSLEFTPDGEWFAAKRTARITLDDKFYGIWEVLARNEYKHFIQHWSDKAVNDKAVYHLYGELFGSNIQKGVNYGTQKRILFYDWAVDNYLQPPDQLIKHLCKTGHSGLCVPVLECVPGLDTALTFSTAFDSHEGPAGLQEGSNEVEGVVIKPANKVYVSPNGSIFMLKNKNAAFKEKQASKKRPSKKRPSTPLAGSVQILKDEFELYLTPERLQNLFSKFGEIENPSQLGLYIKEFITDAREDFIKDHTGAAAVLTKSETKQVFNASKTGIDMLKKFL